MSRPVFYPFYPERILWMGAAVLGIGLAIGGAFLFFCIHSSPFSLFSVAAKKNELVDEGKILSFSFDLKEVPIALSLPRLQPEISFSADLPRPDRSLGLESLFLRLNQSAESKRVALPCRIDLQFNGGKLVFAEHQSPFWLELTELAEDRVQGVVWVETSSHGKVEAERFAASLQASPLRTPQEFPKRSPFQILGEARWLGHDVFAEKYGGQQTLRIGMGSQANLHVLDLKEKEWIVWKEDRWVKGALDEKPLAIARIESSNSKALILEGWEDDTYIRVALAAGVPSPFKIRGEDIFNSIRVRSEKQISCMMDKQCLILKTGDWVMKTNGRWKILRKKEEKEAYQSGKTSGELFVFEKIESKLNQKFMSGFLFNAEKSQVIPIDLPANKQAGTMKK